jgi:hypothetical protein
MIDISKNLQVRNDLISCKVSKLSSGRNAGAFLIKSSESTMVLKSYQQVSDNHGRFVREKLFLEFCLEKEIFCVPKIIDYDYKSKQILLEYLGNSDELEISTGVCVALFEFVKRLNENSDEKFYYAKDAYLDKMNICLDIQRRIQRISKMQLTSPLKLYFGEVTNNFLKSSFRALDKQPSQSGLETKLVRFISPSDVGLHNMLFIKKRYYFIDFEYSGYDNPLKFFCDFVANPSNNVGESLLPTVIDLFQKFFEVQFHESIFNTLKFFYIKWSLILIEHSQKCLLMNQEQGLDQNLTYKLSSLISFTK